MHARFFSLLLILFSTVAAAQYPSRPIHLIVPIPPGGAPDIAARVLGQKLAEQMGEPVVVENRAGSNGNIATELVARAAPDGYTLGLVADSQIAINPHLYSKMSFDTLRDLTPVSSVASNQFVLAINPSLPVGSFPEFIEYARKAKPPLSYASGGNGSQHHLTMEMLKVRTGIDLVHVPYRGGAPATTAAVAGEVAAMWAGSSNAAQIKAGRLRALAVSGSKRSAGPAALPETVLAKLRSEARRALESPDLKERFNHAGGLEPLVLPPDEFAALIRRDYEKYARVVKDLGVKVD